MGDKGEGQQEENRKHETITRGKKNKGSKLVLRCIFIHTVGQVYILFLGFRQEANLTIIMMYLSNCQR